jgi:hypothetical protein
VEEDKCGSVNKEDMGKMKRRLIKSERQDEAEEEAPPVVEPPVEEGPKEECMFCIQHTCTKVEMIHAGNESVKCIMDMFVCANKADKA